MKESGPIIENLRETPPCRDDQDEDRDDQRSGVATHHGAAQKIVCDPTPGQEANAGQYGGARRKRSPIRVHKKTLGAPVIQHRKQCKA